jgi:hypothetical protein
LGDDCPAFVTMVDIDEMVMEACSKFMPSGIVTLHSFKGYQTEFSVAIYFSKVVPRRGWVILIWQKSAI